MATNELDVRISHKRDSASNWSTKNPKLLDGELVVVNDTAGPRLKVGDGTSNYNALQFLDAAAVAHIENKSNPHNVTKEQLNLDNVDNTADANKTVKAANALTVVSKGSATKPVYFNASGVPVACTYSLNADVPSGAKFTDTVYTHPDTHAASMITGLATVATSGNYNDLSNKPTIPSSLPANGGNAATVGGFTVGCNVPADAVFTDTVYTLPNATSSVLGGVKVGTNISVSSGTISVANASTSAKGVVQLSSATNSTSTSLAATAFAVKAAYDLANGKQSPATTLSGYGITDAYTKTEVDNKVAGLVDSAPEALNTLNELAAALGNDANFATTIATQIGAKANTADLAKVATSGSYNDLSNKPTIPTSLPANGGNAATVGGFTVGTNVPADAKFTDTVYTHPSHTAKSSGLYKITVDSLGHVSAATAVAKADITGLGIPAQDTVYTHPSHTAKSSGLYKITVDSLGHVSAATAVAKSDITGLGIPAQDTVYTHPSTHAASMITGLATIATSGSYTDLSNKPTIPAVTKVTFTASDSKWGALANGRYPLTISASGGEFLNCYRTNGSNYDKMDVNVTVSGNNIIIYSLDKFAGYMTYIK